jgi:hypothetical protein
VLARDIRRRFRIIDDQGAVQPKWLLTVRAEVSVVEVGAGRVGDIELVDVLAAGRDRRLADLGNAVLLDRQDEAVPVHGRRLGQLVSHPHAYAIVWLDADHRTGHLTVVGVGADLDVGQDVPAHDGGGQLELLDAVLHRRLEQLTATSIRAGRRRLAHVDRRHVMAAHPLGSGSMLHAHHAGHVVHRLLRHRHLLLVPARGR